MRSNDKKPSASSEKNSQLAAAPTYLKTSKRCKRASRPTATPLIIEKSWELTHGKRPARTDPGTEDPLERALTEVATQAKSHLHGRVNKTLARARQTHVLELARTGGKSEAHTETRMLAGLGTGSRALTALPTCGATTFDNWSLRSFCTQRLNIPPSALGHNICRHCTPIDPRDNAFKKRTGLNLPRPQLPENEGPRHPLPPQSRP